MTGTVSIVHMRRERTHEEFAAEIERLKAAGQPHGVINVDRWKALGCTMMGQVPDVNQFMFVNGEQMKVRDVAWSVQLVADDAVNYQYPQAMLTLAQERPYSDSLTPHRDFYEEVKFAYQ